MAVAIPRGRLRTAHEASTRAWQTDLKTLFDYAKDRYPDVVWELTDGDNSTEEVWGHKAIVYARAPTAFQALYFSFRPANGASPNPYFQSPVPNGQSSYSVNIPYPVQSRSSSPFGDRRDQPSPAPSTTGGLLRLTTSVNPTLFSHELEYLYTGNGMGVAFEFLFDTPEQREGGESEEARTDKLRKDFCYMWRARLYSDVRITLSGDSPPSATDPEEGAPIFFSHRFILASRSPYFRGVLLSEFRAPTISSGPLILTLPSTAFTPASLHWSLGFMYSGTLNFSYRTFDLDTAFAIVRSAAYLSLATMSDEIEAYIVEEMMHGLFHAYLTFEEYEKITAGKWGVGGCKCRQCQRRMPRILDFALSPDVPNRVLEKGARRALVGMFGEGWCSREFADLPAKMRASLLKGVVNRTSPLNIFPLLFASHTALSKLSKLEGSKDDWMDGVREMVLQAQKKIDEILCTQTDICFEQQEWLEIMDSDGLRFGDREKLEWIMEAVKRGLKDNNAGNVYQSLVSSVLLRPHPTDPMASFLPNNSTVRQHAESTRVDILRWLRKHWVQVRLVGGFDNLEQWALREIAQDLEIENENDLVSPPDLVRGPKTRAGLAADSSRDRLDPEMEVASMTSMRANVLTRNLSKSNADSTRSAATAASTSGVRRPAPSRDVPTPPRLANGSASPRRTLTSPVPSPVGTSMTPSQPKLNTNLSRPEAGDTLEPSTSLSASTTSSAPSVSPVPRTGTPTRRRGVGTSATNVPETPASGKPKSITPSVRSNAATPTTRRNGGAPPPTPSSTTSSSAISRTTATSTSTARPKPSLGRGAGISNAGDTTPRASIASRPVSSAATSFESAASELQIPPRQRTLSAASATSTAANAPMKVKPRSPSVAGPSQRLRPRRTSTASVASVASSVASPKPVKPSPTTMSPDIRLMPKRPASQASIRSVRSTVSTASKAPAERKRIESAPKPPVPKLVTPKIANKAPSIRSVASVKGKEKAQPSPKPEVSVVVLKRSTASLKGKEKATTTKPSPSPKASPKVPEKVEPKETAAEAAKEPTPTNSVLSARSDGASTIRGAPPGLNRKHSADTVTEVSAISAETHVTVRPTHTARTESSSTVKSNDTIKGHPVAIPSSDGTAPGVVLNVGIPCIITSKRARFRAYARYLGNVVGEYGPWVGVEVPLGQAEKLQDRDWHDGTWGGLKYFDITRPEWDENDERMNKRRRLNIVNESRKRDGDTMSLRERRSNRRLRSVSPAFSDVSMQESRGLFVRPNQVIYVIDAREDI